MRYEQVIDEAWGFAHESKKKYVLGVLALGFSVLPPV